MEDDIHIHQAELNHRIRECQRNQPQREDRQALVRPRNLTPNVRDQVENGERQHTPQSPRSQPFSLLPQNDVLARSPPNVEQDSAGHEVDAQQSVLDPVEQLAQLNERKASFHHAHRGQMVQHEHQRDGNISRHRQQFSRGRGKFGTWKDQAEMQEDRGHEQGRPDVSPVDEAVKTRR